MPFAFAEPGLAAAAVAEEEEEDEEALATAVVPLVVAVVAAVAVPLEDDAVAEEPAAVDAQVAVCGRSVTFSPSQMALANWIVSTQHHQYAHLRRLVHCASM